MQKILLTCPDVSMINDNPDIQAIKTLADLPSSGTGSEYFINAHGLEFFYKPTNLGLWGKIKSYFMSEPSYLSMNIFSNDGTTSVEGTTSVLDITLLNKIQNNTTANQCNIVHIFSCHSGAAQHHLDWIQGNMVLCTYSKASDVSSVILAQKNFNARTQNDSLLIEYIRDNFHLLVASDFSISYKLDDQIYSFSLSANKIKKMESITELPAFLHKKYKAFVKFYKNIYSEYHESYPEIFNLNIETKPKELTYADLIQVFSRALTLETYNFNKFSLSKIETMLNQKGLYIDTSIGCAIEHGNSALLICLLNYGNAKINSYNLNKAIESGNVAILKAVLEHSTTNIESYNLNKAIENGNLAILKAVLEHSTTNIESYNLTRAIESGNLAILKAVLEHSTTNVEPYNITKAIKSGDVAILKAVLKHSTINLESYNLQKAMQEGNLEILDIVLKHPTLEVSSYNINMAEETHNLDVIELVKKYYNSTINTITSEENTIYTTLTVVEEVPALGEGTEGV